MEKKFNPFSPTVPQVLEFLNDYFKTGVGYSALNTARSALSSIITLPGNVTIGEHPLVKRFMRGIFNIKPSLPRYTTTWDVSVLLKYLESVDNAQSSLKELTFKLCTLIAILSGQRVQTLKALKVTNVIFKDRHLSIYVDSLLKQTRPGRHFKALEFEAYSNPNLCVLRTLEIYLNRTSKIRGSNELFISYARPHGSVGTETISRWIRLTLEKAGVDVSTFKAHSTRSASASALASAGVPVDSILQMIGWSNANTFARFYNKEITRSRTFDEELLKASSSDG